MTKGAPRRGEPTKDNLEMTLQLLHVNTHNPTTRHAPTPPAPKGGGHVTPQPTAKKAPHPPQGRERGGVGGAVIR